MDAGRRHAAAEAFWTSEKVKDFDRAAVVEFLAAAMRFRPQSIRTAPRPKRIGLLAGCHSLNDHVAGTILFAYHMERQAPLMGRFLDALGIEHEKGQIRSEVTPPSKEALEKAVDAILAGSDRQDVTIYLETLLSQDPDTWGPLAAILDERLSE
jgi:hypothetical protein